jgi:hypothetical protein
MGQPLHSLPEQGVLIQRRILVLPLHKFLVRKIKFILFFNSILPLRMRDIERKKERKK